MGFSKQEYWSGLPFPSPGDLPGLRIEPGSPALQADSLPSELPGKPMSIRGASQTSTLGLGHRVQGRGWKEAAPLTGGHTYSHAGLDLRWHQQLFYHQLVEKKFLHSISYMPGTVASSS